MKTRLPCSFFTDFKEVKMNQNTNNYLAEERIGKLLLKFSIPCIMSLLVSSLYNIIMGVMNNVLVKYGAMSKYGADIPLTVVGIYHDSS